MISILGTGIKVDTARGFCDGLLPVQKRKTRTPHTAHRTQLAHSTTEGRDDREKVKRVFDDDGAEIRSPGAR